MMEKWYIETSGLEEDYVCNIRKYAQHKINSSFGPSIYQSLQFSTIRLKYNGMLFFQGG